MTTKDTHTYLYRTHQPLMKRRQRNDRARAYVQRVHDLLVDPLVKDMKKGRA